MKAMRIILLTVLIPLALTVIPLFPQDAPEQPAVATPDQVKLCRLQTDQDLWSGPSTNFKIVRKARTGLLLEIIGEKADYYRIRVPDGFPCFIFHDYLMVDDGSMGTVTGENVWLRSIPRIEGDYPIFQVDRGEEFMVWERTGEWYRVTAPEDAYLYVLKSEVSFVEETDEVQKELQALKANRGVSWSAHQSAIQEQLIQQRKTEEARNRIDVLDEAVAGGFAVITADGVLEGFKDLAANAPDASTRQIAQAKVKEIEALNAKQKADADLKAREEAWREEKNRLLREIDSAKAAKPEPATYKSPGRGRAIVVIGMVDVSRPTPVLRGGKSLADVLYRIEVTDGRYILADFNVKRIKILGRVADPPRDEDPTLLVIERIEIL